VLQANKKSGRPTPGQLADLELRHRGRARCEDRIRVSKDTGLANLPLHDFAQNQVWCAIVALALELTAWLQMLTLAGHDARRWEPERLRLRVFSVAERNRADRHTPGTKSAENGGPPAEKINNDGLVKDPF